ncbi:MAG: hypothetical protein PHW69_08140 [Elusimicrobiaceae bacterium]|nr:hypothetical protein [Elusimicrobiaceae bacterium]
MLTENDIADIIYGLLSGHGLLSARAGGDAAAGVPACAVADTAKISAAVSGSVSGPGKTPAAGPGPKEFKSGYATGFYKGFSHAAKPAPGKAAAFGAKGGRYYGPAARPKRVFMTDRELRIMLRPGSKLLTVPRGTVISPLALDWIEFEAIGLRFE